MTDSVLIVGASLAGISTARALRRKGFTGAITLLGEERHAPYDRPPLSKQLLAGEWQPGDIGLTLPDEDLQLTMHLGVPAVRLDPDSRTVTLADGTTHRADAVVLATGAVARPLPDTPPLAGVHLLRTLDDAQALQADLLAGHPLVVVGSGFIGSEVASTARRLGVPVTVTEASSAPLVRVLGEQMGVAVGSLHERGGAQLLLGTAVVGLTGEQRVRSVRLADGRELPAGTVVVGIGSAPAVNWLSGTGLADPAVGVRCDVVGRTPVRDVFAVGDCSAWRDETIGAHRREEHWFSARDRAAVVADVLVGDDAAAVTRARRVLPYVWSDQHGLRIQLAGDTSVADSVELEEGSVEEASFLAVYRRAGAPVAVLGVDRVRPFVRWRKQLARDHAAALEVA